MSDGGIFFDINPENFSLKILRLSKVFGHITEKARAVGLALEFSFWCG